MNPIYQSMRTTNVWRILQCAKYPEFNIHKYHYRCIQSTSSRSSNKEKKNKKITRKRKKPLSKQPLWQLKLEEFFAKDSTDDIDETKNDSSNGKNRKSTSLISTERKFSKRRIKDKKVTKESTKILASISADIPKPTQFDSLSLFISCKPGLEPYLRAELCELGIKFTQESYLSTKNISREEGGGVHCTVDSIDKLLSCHLHLGTASHILLRAGPPFQARGFEELVRKVSKMVFWKQYIEVDQKIYAEGQEALRSKPGLHQLLPNLDISVTSTKSRLYHSKAISERIERGIWNALGLNGEDIMKIKHSQEIVDKEKHETISIKIHARLKQDNVQISVDTSTTPLHRRGYRLETTKAPLREDIAFALLLSSGWGRFLGSQNRSLLDPFCGSGTIPIEGVTMALGIPPGRLRERPNLPFHMCTDKYWKNYVTSSLDKAYLKMEDKHVDFGKIALASDRDQGAIDAAIRNATRADVIKFIDFESCSISSNSWLNKPECAPMDVLCCTNPPFGHRVKKDQDVKSGNFPSGLLPLYQKLGHDISRLKGNGVGVGILVQNVDIGRRIAVEDISLEPVFSTNHGGLNVCALTNHNFSAIDNEKTN